MLLVILSSFDSVKNTYPVHQVVCVLGERGPAADQLQEDHPEGEGVGLDVHEAHVPGVHDAVGMPAAAVHHGRSSGMRRAPWPAMTAPSTSSPEMMSDATGLKKKAEGLLSFLMAPESGLRWRATRSGRLPGREKFVLNWSYPGSDIALTVPCTSPIQGLHGAMVNSAGRPPFASSSWTPVLGSGRWQGPVRLFCNRFLLLFGLFVLLINGEHYIV